MGGTEVERPKGTPFVWDQSLRVNETGKFSFPPSLLWYHKDWYTVPESGCSKVEVLIHSVHYDRGKSRLPGLRVSIIQYTP